MTNMSVKDLIYLAVSYRATNISALAREMGMKRQNLHRKIKMNTLTKEDMCKIAEVLGGRYMSSFVFPGGIRLGDPLKLRKARTKAHLIDQKSNHQT